MAVSHIGRIVKVMAATRGEETKELELHTYQRLGIGLQRGNAAMLARRMETLHTVHYAQKGGIGHLCTLWAFVPPVVLCTLLSMGLCNEYKGP